MTKTNDVQNGEWMTRYDYITDEFEVVCSCCNFGGRVDVDLIINANNIQVYDRCPKCGAYMKGEKK